MKNAKINKRNLVEQVYELLKADILGLRLKSGERINLSAMAKSLDISVSPVREAMNRLVKDRLVVYNHNRGCSVVKLTSKEIEDLFHLRKIFESETLIDFARRENRDLYKEKFKKLRAKMVNSMKNKNETKRRRDFVKIDEEFHKMIVNVSNNLMLKRLFSQIWDLVVLTQHIDREIDHSLTDHLAIIDALLENSVDKAIELLCSHIRDTEERLLKMVDKFK